MLIDQANSQIVNDTLEQFTALVTIERLTGTKTTRTRNQLLQSLESAELLAVSVELQRRGLLGGAR
jgi:hypothetical protein